MKHVKRKAGSGRKAAGRRERTPARASVRAPFSNRAGQKRSSEVRSSEDELVRRIAAAAGAGSARNGARYARASGLGLGIGDDAALWQPRAGHETVLTCDWFLEGTHFLRAKHPPESVGWKCLARAVSDIAAMGGQPRCFLLSLALPASHTGAWLDGFLAGLRRAQKRLGCVLAGGDVTRSERILINVTVVGEIARGRAVRRSGAKPGDIVFVSGRLGEAELGLHRLRAAKRVTASDPLLRKHLYPEPRLELGAWLAKRRLASAMMDLSDGLSSDLARLCEASGVGAKIEAARVPVARAAGIADAQALHAALHGGDDYELLFTVAARNQRHVPLRASGVPLTPIGVITRERKVLLITDDGNARRNRDGKRGETRLAAASASGRRGGDHRRSDARRKHAEPLAAAGWDPFGVRY